MTRLVRGLGGVAAMAVAAVAGLAGAQQVFRGSTDLVLLNVTVNDARGRAIEGLARGDFQIFEDGRPQELTVFSRESQPIAYSILLDTSASMEPHMPIAQRAAIGLASRIGANDIAQVIAFQTTALIAQAFTPDRSRLEAAIRQSEAGGRTAMYDAVYIALDASQRTERPAGEPLRRQVIVLLSDGEDTASHKEYEDVIDLSRRSDVIIYAIGLRPKDGPPDRGWNEAEFVLRTITRQSGGRVFFVSDTTELPAIYVQIADELARQYTLGYRSTNQKKDGAWRSVAVQLTGGQATARSKAGYYGPSRER